VTGSPSAQTFRLAYVPGVTPAKWVRTWGERLPGVPLELAAVTAADAQGALTGGDADAGLVRLPVDRTQLSAIPLYAETTVVLVPKDHEVTAAEEVEVADLGGYIVLHPMDDCLAWDTLPGQPAISRPETTADAVELVAAGIGVLMVPQSLARLHHRKDLTYRTVTDAPQSQVALSWLEGQTTDLVEEFIGIVRGRTVNSSRGRGQGGQGQGTQAQASEKDKAKAKAKPKAKAAATKPKPRGGGDSGGRGRAPKPAKTAKPRRRK
jgi:DNA-binding transcriptional LysR family regulator